MGCGMESCQKLLQIIENKNWDAVDYETVVELLEKSDWSDERKQEVYQILYEELRRKEYKTIYNWLRGKIHSWPWILLYFPVGVAVLSVLLGYFNPWFFITGILVLVSVTISDVWGKFQSHKARKKLDHLRDKGFNLYVRDIPVLWGSSDREKNC